MKVILILLVFLTGNMIFAPTNSCGQQQKSTKYLFFDTFDDNRHDWNMIDNSFASQQISHGKMRMEYKKDQRNWRFIKSIPVNPDVDFSIETIVTQVSGPDNYGYGLLWGTQDQGNNFNFTIASNGLFRVWGYENERYFAWQEWLSSKAVNPTRIQNKLAIVKKQDVLKFYINDHLVYTNAFKPFAGSLTGFVTGRNTTIEADYLKITQEIRPINLVSKSPQQEKQDPGSDINSKRADICPIISPDGNRLYFARRIPVKNSLGLPSTDCDIFYCDKTDQGTWSKARRMNAPINNSGDNLVISVSADGNTLLLEGLYDSKGNYAGDQGISVSHRTKYGWSIPEKVEIEQFYNQNEYESYGHSPDRTILIMSVQREDTYGRKDLYVSFLQEDGSYSTPLNMGPDLNTQLDEGTPFIAPDNKTLYFYSYGHPGYGSADIFVSRRQDESWTYWSTPKNLGPNINGKEWDTYYSVSAKGDKAYLVSVSDENQQEDIFEIPLNEEARPDPVVLVKGKVLDQKTQQPVEASIVYHTFKNEKTIGSAQSDPSSGSYNIILQYGHHYGYHAEAEGYLALHESIDLSEISRKNYQEITMDLFLVPLQVGEVLELKNVRFVQNKAELLEISYPGLNRLTRIMQEYPDMEIELSGHTETRGNKKQLLKLSEERVESVTRYLTEHGIKKSRIKGKGFGASQPLYQGNSDMEKYNRRVEMRITKM